MVVATPVMAPRTAGAPRPVTSHHHQSQQCRLDFCRTKLRPLMVLLERFDFVGMNLLHNVRRRG
jgi:hypothetical protein